MKQKRETYFTTVPKLTSIVPPPDKYPLEKMVNQKNWELKMPKKFPIEKRNTYVDQIFTKSKIKEKSTPGAPQYLKEKAHRYTLGKIHGSPQKTD